MVVVEAEPLMALLPALPDTYGDPLLLTNLHIGKRLTTQQEEQ